MKRNTICIAAFLTLALFGIACKERSEPTVETVQSSRDGNLAGIDSVPGPFITKEYLDKINKAEAWNTAIQNIEKAEKNRPRVNQLVKEITELREKAKSASDPDEKRRLCEQIKTKMKALRAIDAFQATLQSQASDDCSKP